MQQFLNESPFGQILLINKRGNSNAVLHELLARELYDVTLSEFERWFHVGGRDIRFGPQEFCLITGLHFGPSNFNPNVRNHVIPRTSLFYTKYNGNAIKVKRLLNDFKNLDIRLGSPDQYLSAANLLMYYFMILCRDDHSVDDWAWTLVEDRERWDSFPWGSWAFQILCHQLGVAKKDPIEIGGEARAAYHLYGPVWAFDLWAYEAIPALGRACGKRVNADDTPRLRRWETWTSHLDFSGFFDNHEVIHSIIFFCISNFIYYIIYSKL